MFLYYEIFVRHDAVALLKSYQSIFTSKFPSFLLVLLLMPVNWLLETIKWTRLFGNVNVLKPIKAFKGVLMGVALGLFTPNGVGEFGGRIWVVNKEHREQAISSSITGSLAQLCITITVGGGFVVFFISQFVASQWLLTAQVLGGFTIVFGVIAFYKMPRIVTSLLKRFPYFQRFDKFQSAMISYDRRALTEAYMWSLLRYVVFCTQLAILLITVGSVDHQYIVGLVCLIPVYYYIQTIVPTVALSEIGVRGMILLFLFSNILVDSDVIVVSFVIWIINLIIPGLFGLFFLAQTKFIKA